VAHGGGAPDYAGDLATKTASSQAPARQAERARK